MCRALSSVVFAPDHTRMLALLVCRLKHSQAAVAAGWTEQRLLARALQSPTVCHRVAAFHGTNERLPADAHPAAFKRCPCESEVAQRLCGGWCWALHCACAGDCRGLKSRWFFQGR